MSTTMPDIIDPMETDISEVLPPWSPLDMSQYLGGKISDKQCELCGDCFESRTCVCIVDWWWDLDDPLSYVFAVHEACMLKDCFEGSTLHITWEDCAIYALPPNDVPGFKEPLGRIYVRYPTYTSTFKSLDGRTTTVALRELTVVRNALGTVSYLDAGSPVTNISVISQDSTDEFERGLLKHLGWM